MGIAAVLYAVAVASCASGFRVMMSLNEIPRMMATSPESWAASRLVCDGVVGAGRPNSVSPLSRAEREGVVDLFPGKPHVLGTSLAVFKGAAVPGVNWTNIFQWYANDTGFDAVTDVFLWDGDGRTLTAKQLHRVGRAGFKPVVVVARGDEPLTDDMRAAFRHQMCRGVAVTAAFIQPTLRAEGVRIARYVADLGKTVFIVRPPSWPAEPYLQQLREFMGALRRDLGEVVCTDQLAVVLNAAPVQQTQIAFLPDSIGGVPADTYTGGVLMLGQYAEVVCPSGPPYGPPSPVPPMAPAGTLKAAAARSSRIVGAAVTVRGLAVPGYVAAATEHYSLLGAQNELKWQATEPSQNAFEYADGDRIQQFAASLGARMHGHCLVWHRFLPTWVTALAGGALRDAMVNHIAHVVGHYARKIGTWDVVNEAVADVGQPADAFGLRTDSIWQQQLGLSFIDVAYRTARAVDPGALLMYNDYLIEQDGEKTRRVASLVSGMMSRGVPIDGVGFQSHMWGGANYTLLARAIKRFTDLGLFVRISEMTDDVTSFQGTLAQKFAQQAIVYGEFTRVCSQNPLCQGVVTWEFSDAFSSGAYPLPFDAEYGPKPAFFAMLNALEAAFPAYVGPNERAV